jgi:hypothetical protein
MRKARKGSGLWTDRRTGETRQVWYSGETTWLADGPVPRGRKRTAIRMLPERKGRRRIPGSDRFRQREFAFLRRPTGFPGAISKKNIDFG